MEGRKMASKSKLWSFIFILISGAILLFPFVAYAQTPIDCGQTLAGSISAPAEIDSYTFSGSVNDVITIRSRKTSGTFTVYLSLYSPGGSLLQSGAQINRTLTETGTYRIDVRDQNNTNTGDYLLYWQRLSSPCNVVADLPCDQVVSGSIGTTTVDPPPWRIYTFTAAANEAVTIRSRNTSGGSFTPYIELYNPSGAFLQNGSYMDRTLTVAGTYTILMRDYYNTYGGNFNLSWRKVSTPPCNSAPINCGQTLSGSITAADQINFYTFTAAANDVVTIRTRKVSGSFTTVFDLYSPSGTQILSGAASTNWTQTLTAAGTYKILMRDSGNANTGDYLLYLERMNIPCNVVADLPCDQVVSGSIGTTTVDPPPWRIYTFTAAANEAVTIRSRNTSGGSFTPYIELYNPSGAFLQNGSYMDRTLTVAGTYTILMRDYYNTYGGNFNLSWRKVSTPPCNSAPINCGQTLSGSITAADQINFYTFTAAANDVVTIRTRKVSGSFTTVFDLYSPSGTQILSGAASTNWTQTLTAAGTYKILMRDSGNANTGDYLLYLEKTNSPCNAAPITCGQVLTGSIGTSTDPPPWKAYTFTGTAGDAVSIRSLKTSAGSFISYMELYGPNGGYIGGYYNYPLDRTLTATGTHTILMRDYYNANAGDFLLVWQRMNNPCVPELSCGQTATGNIGRTTSEPHWGFHKISVSANDVVKIRAIKTSGSLVPYLELYSFSGSVVTSAAGEINTTLTAAGTYTIVVRDQTNTYTGGYAVTWQKWNNPCASALNCGQVASGSIGITADPPPWRYYSLTASANDIVTIRATKTSGTLTPYLEIYNSSGTQVASGAGQKDTTLATAGTYTIVVRDQNNINTGNYTFYWNRIPNPCNAVALSCGQVFPASVAAVGEIDAYTITVSGGDNIVLTLTKTSGGLDPSLELYNSSGTRVAYQYTPSGNETVITQTLSTGGTYTVFASDYGNDETGSYTLKFQKNNNSCTEVSLLLPNGGESILARSTYTIHWSCTSPSGVTSQEIKLSTDGGMSFPTSIVTGLAGDVRAYNWNVPSELSTNQGRIRVIATDGSMANAFDDSDADFTINQVAGRIYVYDEYNRLIQVIYEDGKKVTYTYDAAGNRITLINEQ